MFTIKSPFAEIANRHNSTECAPSRDVPRIKFANLARTEQCIDNITKINKTELKERMAELLEIILKQVEHLEGFNKDSIL